MRVDGTGPTSSQRPDVAPRETDDADLEATARHGGCSGLTKEEPMSYVIAEPCIATCDQACLDVCPVDAIHGPMPNRELAAVPKAERGASAAPAALHRSRGLHLLRSLRAGVPGLGDLRGRRPTDGVATLPRDQRGVLPHRRRVVDQFAMRADRM
jgi:ferredoxin